VSLLALVVLRKDDFVASAHSTAVPANTALA